MALPEQLLLSDLLRLRVRCDQGLDHGPGVLGWMHPPVHRLLGWVSRPSAFRPQRQVWRLDQLRGLSDSEAFVKGEPAAADPAVLEQLPTLLQAALLGAGGRPLGTVADAAVQLASGRILHYLVARSDPRLPGSSRWRLTPDRIVDQRSGAVVTALESLDDLPLARSSVRQELLRRSRRWREQVSEETSRLREQFEVVGGRLEERVEGWLEEPPWEELREPRRGGEEAADPLDDWDDQSPPPRPPGGRRDPIPEPWDELGDPGPSESADEEPQTPWTAAGEPDSSWAEAEEPGSPWSEPDPPEARGGRSRRQPPYPPERRDPGGFRRGPDRYRGRDLDDDPWV